MDNRVVAVSGDRLGKLEGQVEEGFKHFNQSLVKVERDIHDVRSDIRDAITQMALNTQSTHEANELTRKAIANNESLKNDMNNLEKKVIERQCLDKAELKQEIGKNSMELKRIATIITAIAFVVTIFREPLLKMIGF